MNGELHKLMLEVERELTLLDALPDTVPTPAAVARVRSAVVATARLQGERRRRLGFVVGVLSAAAAVLLACGLTTRPVAPMPVADTARMAATWTNAFDESGEKLASLIDGGWLTETYGNGNSTRDVDDLLDSFDETLDAWNAL